MLWTPVPKTSIDEHGDFCGDKDDVDSDTFDATMQSESQPLSMKGRTQSDFRSGVLPLDSLHDLRATQASSRLITLLSFDLFSQSLSSPQPLASSETLDCIQPRQDVVNTSEPLLHLQLISRPL